jgi:hypothetical protein
MATAQSTSDPGFHPHRGWLIAWGWPASSIAFIGLLTGFWLLFSGIWRITLDGRARRPGDDGLLSPA